MIGDKCTKCKERTTVRTYAKWKGKVYHRNCLPQKAKEFWNKALEEFGVKMFKSSV